MKKILFELIIGLIMIVLGVLMILEGKYIVGRDLLTQQGSVVSGFCLIGVGVIIIWTGYYNLSPFGKIRRFIERYPRKKE